MELLKFWRVSQGHRLQPVLPFNRSTMFQAQTYANLQDLRRDQSIQGKGGAQDPLNLIDNMMRFRTGNRRALNFSLTKKPWLPILILKWCTSKHATAARIWQPFFYLKKR